MRSRRPALTTTKRRPCDLTCRARLTPCRARGRVVALRTGVTEGGSGGGCCACHTGHRCTGRVETAGTAGTRLAHSGAAGVGKRACRVGRNRWRGKPERRRRDRDLRDRACRLRRTRSNNIPLDRAPAAGKDWRKTSRQGKEYMRLSLEGWKGWLWITEKEQRINALRGE